jgi:monoamine oxidase
MARTRLFARLRRLLNQVQGASSLHSAPDAQAGAATPAPSQTGLGRRRWLQGSLAAVGLQTTGLSAMGLGLVSGCDTPTLIPIKDEPEAGAPQLAVAVIGGGMAGLHCAYRLHTAKVKVAVYEASKRLGGRMYTDRESFAPQVAELGGEFIDSDHTTLHTLAEELEIELDDREADLGEDTVRDVWWIDGVAVPEATVVEQFSQVAPLMADLVHLLDEEGDEELYAELDQTSLADWLDENVPADTYPELHAILTNAYRGEYGLETPEQSSLNLLYLIGADDPDPFRIFGDSDERYHTHLGSQTFIDELEKRVDEDSIFLEHKLVKVSGPRNGPFTLEFDTPDEARVILADRVVFALPFSVLREVDLSDLDLPEDKLRMIAELGYGTNAKLMGAFESRVWRTDHDASGSVTSDAPFQQCWDTSIGQGGNAGLLTNYLGGRSGAEADEGTAEAHYGAFVTELDALFGGVEADYVAGSAVRMHWPTHPFTKGSYACYRPGQWAFWSLEGEAVGKLHFCGEHTSLEYQGYMEGAAETGARAAGEILEALGLTPTAIHQALLDLRRGLPRRSPRGVPQLLARRRALRNRLGACLDAQRGQLRA